MRGTKIEEGVTITGRSHVINSGKESPFTKCAQAQKGIGLTIAKNSKKRVPKRAIQTINPKSLTECQDLDEQVSAWFQRAANSKACRSGIGAIDTSRIQFKDKPHAKGKAGSFKAAPSGDDVKAGERIRSRGTISVPTRATDAISMNGVDVARMRRLLEGLVAMDSEGLEQADKRKRKVDRGLVPSAERLAYCKAQDKAEGGNIREAELYKGFEDKLNDIALAMLAEVGTNPDSDTYVDLPDPATLTISCAVKCPNCESEREFSERRIPLSEKAVLKLAKTLHVCGECFEDGSISGAIVAHRVEYKGGAEALAKRAVDKFNKLAAERAGGAAALPTPDQSGADLKTTVIVKTREVMDKEMSALF